MKRSASDPTQRQGAEESFRELCWDGITKSKTLTVNAARERHHLADRAKNCDWVGLLKILEIDSRLVNTTRPDGKAKYAPLHHAAYGGAPEHLVSELLRLGAFRTLRDSQGHRPVDIARNRSHRHLLTILEPVSERRIRPDVLTMSARVKIDHIAPR
jgi:hypothetical protein